jgi:hypothetical protein
VTAQGFKTAESQIPCDADVPIHAELIENGAQGSSTIGENPFGYEDFAGSGIGAGGQVGGDASTDQ